MKKAVADRGDAPTKETTAERPRLAEAGTKIMRMQFALKIIRAFCMDDYSSTVYRAMRQWIDDGMSGPVPWPRCPFFDQWAGQQGWSNVDGYVGFRFTAELVREEADVSNG